MERIKNLVKLGLSKQYRRWVAVAILLLTIVIIGRFFVDHPAYWQQLGRVSPWVIVGVVLLNIPAMASLALAYDAMLQLCGKRIPLKENVLLTAYSSIVNFFGPLQSGPGVRAVYLKIRHNVRVRDFTLATLLYFALYATYSALFLVIGMRPWWQTVLLLLAVGGFSVAVIRWFSGRASRKPEGLQQFRLRPQAIGLLALGAFMQLSCIAGYYFVELHAVNPHIGLNQAISYSGAANFALFVSITPDAVGIREAFLVFSQSVHHVATKDIVNANIIDRGSYVIYLALLFLFTLSIHARDRLRIGSLQPTNK